MAGPADVGMINTFRDAGANIYANLGTITLSLFITLAVIQVAIYVIRSLIANEEPMKFFVGLGQLFFLIGFFYLFLFHSAEWISAIFSGMIDFAKTGMGAAANSVDPSPSGMINLGMKLSSLLFSAAASGGFFSGIAATFVAIFMSFFIMILIGLMAMEVTIVYCKYFVAAAMSALFVAVAPLDFTRPMTMNYVKAMIGLSLQMFTIVILISVFATISVNWADMITEWTKDITQMQNIWIIPAQMIIFYGLMKHLPPWVAAISGIGGFANHSDTAIMAAGVGAGLAAKGTMGVLTGKGMGGVGLTTVAPTVGRGLVSGGKTFGSGLAQAVTGNGTAGRVGGIAKAGAGIVGGAGGHAAKSASTEALKSLKNKMSSNPEKSNRNFGQRMNDGNRAQHGTPLKNLSEKLKGQASKLTTPAKNPGSNGGNSNV